RLLDWTYSPLVALHFATGAIEHMHCDGAVWKVDYHQASRLLPPRLGSKLTELSSNVFTTDLLSELVDNLDEFDLLSKSDFVMFLEPPSIDDRIVNQFALFSIISNARVALDSWLETHPELYTKVVIPAALKWEIRDKLDQANITERVLFPGLSGLSCWLRRHYSARGSEARD
ncbi:MAG: FRG domain-containing protein, partial [Gammaproteobacteria bacterium]|nr:FRG domain-containing protein [Gammaproteobacteria bacterium]